MRAGLLQTFQSLTVRNYRLYASGQLIKLLGVWTMFVAQDWLVLTLSDDSATAVGIVVALQFTPLLLLTLLGGALADRYDKRKLLMVVNACFAVLAVVMAVLVLAGVVQLWHVFALAGLMGVVNALENPARQSFVSELVGTRLLPNALSLSSSVFNFARIGGSALAGVSIGALGLGPTFAIAAAAAAAPLVSLARIRPAELYREPRSGAARGSVRVIDGIRYVERRPDLVMAMALVAVIGFAGFNFQVTLAVLSKVVYQTEPSAFGILLTSLAIGSLAGALAGSWRRSRPSGYLMAGAGTAFGAFALLVGLADPYWLVAALLLPTGFFAVFFAQAANQRVQLGCDGGIRGRVMALYVLVFLGTTPVGALAVGWWSEVFGPASAIGLGGLISLLAAVAALAWQLRRRGEVLRVRIRPRPRVYVVRTG